MDAVGPASAITALLGPTNTGKTHRAVERMLTYPSGMIGLPLRLLAREVYERIPARASEARVAPRSCVVACSMPEVYVIAERLRALRGGAAVVLGALSPRTRNAQVALFQAGEVDYLVATDAIGMGLNLDVGHVAFSSLRKF